ncbi:DUF4391 domain-containing protein [Poseidonibacter antarcticus]|uniref:DUF4391 domain-containing protein n=1 Tax=Poseidonibacter antarcticus TaxID=2478538 RepID=UPI000EF4CE10|nr:DUF4391 domain-containing protein [Poseidonibacter antarcticus]
MHDFKLPSASIVNRFLPKKVFEEKIKNAKKIFKSIIKITLKHKLCSQSINTPETKNIKEILIIQIKLNEKEVPKEAIKNISKLINRPILYEIVYEEEYCFAIFTLDNSKCFLSPWNEKKEFNFQDINLEKIYENTVKTFLNTKNETLNLNELIKKEKEIQELKKQISTLENKIKKEKVFKRQLELSRSLKPLQTQLQEELKNIQKDEN